jgi:hypothetical protein
MAVGSMMRRPVVKPLATRQPGRPSSTTSDVEVLHLCGHRAVFELVTDDGGAVEVFEDLDLDENRPF